MVFKTFLYSTTAVGLHANLLLCQRADFVFGINFAVWFTSDQINWKEDLSPAFNNEFTSQSQLKAIYTDEKTYVNCSAVNFHYVSGMKNIGLCSL